VIENSSENIPITKEMIVDKIDAELAEFTGSTPVANRGIEFEDKLEALTLIRNALYNLPIPHELHPFIFNHENILREAFLFWLDEAVKTMPLDRLALSYDCAANWLTEVRHEYRTALLRERLAGEHQAFLEEERQKTPDEIIEDAWKITCMADLLTVLTNGGLEPQEIDALLTIEHPLHTIFGDFLPKDNENHLYALTDIALEVAQTRHNDLVTGNIDLQPEDAVTKQHLEEYLKFYGGPAYSAEQDVPDHEPEWDMELEP